MAGEDRLYRQRARIAHAPPPGITKFQSARRPKAAQQRPLLQALGSVGNAPIDGSIAKNFANYGGFISHGSRRRPSSGRLHKARVYASNSAAHKVNPQRPTTPAEPPFREPPRQTGQATSLADGSVREGPTKALQQRNKFLNGFVLPHCVSLTLKLSQPRGGGLLLAPLGLFSTHLRLGGLRHGSQCWPAAPGIHPGRIVGGDRDHWRDGWAASACRAGGA